MQGHSATVVLGTGFVGDDGTVSIPIVIPPTMPLGYHTIELIAADENTVPSVNTTTMRVTVAPLPWWTWLLCALGALALVAGVVLLWRQRRRPVTQVA